MIYFLVGHRGTGKTSLLSRLKKYFPKNVLCFDLDQEVERSAQKTVVEIFAKDGEASFRSLEVSTLNEILHKIFETHSHLSDEPIIISLGAGFDLREIKNVRNKEIIWIKRSTDRSGRIFLDRPRLNQKLNQKSRPLDEYFGYFQERNELFKTYSTIELNIPEGWFFENETEEYYFENLFCGQKNEIKDQTTKHVMPNNAFITVYPKNLSHIQLYLTFGFLLELRTDILSQSEIDLVYEKVPPHKILLSIRNQLKQEEIFAIPQEVKVDWPCELGAPDPHLLKENKIFSFSFHNRKHQLVTEDLSDFKAYLKSHVGQYALNKSVFFKLSLEIYNFSELITVHNWIQEQSGLYEMPKVSFLPRRKGEYHWYRLLHKFDYPLQFVTFGQEGQEDLPLFLDWIRIQNKSKHFAAVIGYPVNHSWTPATHTQFFSQEMSGEPVFAISITKEEKVAAFKFLTSLGLKYVAITSPLKGESGINTQVILSNDNVQETNTDLFGLKKLFTHILGDVVVWGGGGTLCGIKDVLSQTKIKTRFFSARTGQEREPQVRTDKNHIQITQAATLIWAAPSNQTKELEAAQLTMPDLKFKPKVVLDLSYVESSLAREYALSCGAKYVSGIEMFKEQAKHQQIFWKTYGS